jgi:hypothetical protein
VQTQLLLLIDRFLISLYRLTGIAMIDFFIGTTIVSLFCVLIGQVTYLWVYRQNHQHLLISEDEMVQMHTLSMDALRAKDKYGYTSYNRLANDAFGKYFFAQIAIGMAAIWPLPFALWWMKMRFGKVDFPLPWVDFSVGYQFTFFPIYILVHLSFRSVKTRILNFKQQHQET